MSKNNIIRTACAMLPTKYGMFRVAIYKSLIDNSEHTVLFVGDIRKQKIMVRVHSQCLTGDTFFSLKCDCGEQLKQSMRMIGREGRGVIIYLNQEGRGIGLSDKIKAYSLQEKGHDTVEANLCLNLPADARDYTLAAEILDDLGVREIVILTNNPDKIGQLKKKGIKIISRMPLETKPNKFNKKYLIAKKLKLGHLLSKV
jgi:3,4-dihydroxy 2-butanone 4-phosphate synthase/GTP cyclohydrolase II